MSVRLPVSEQQVRDLMAKVQPERDRWRDVENDHGKYNEANWVMFLCQVVLGEKRANPGSSRGKCRVLLEKLVAKGWPRVEEKCPGRGHRDHVADVCDGECCTACGGPIDENEACRC